LYWLIAAWKDKDQNAAAFLEDPPIWAQKGTFNYTPPRWPPFTGLRFSGHILAVSISRLIAKLLSSTWNASGEKWSAENRRRGKPGWNIAFYSLISICPLSSLFPYCPLLAFPWFSMAKTQLVVVYRNKQD